MSEDLISLGEYRWQQGLDGSPSPAEQAFLNGQLRRLHQIESRSRGLYCETLVASLLGDEVHESVLASSPWDLCWKGFTIGIRASGRYNNETPLDANHEPTKQSTPSWGFKEKTWWDEAVPPRRTATDIVVLGLHSSTLIDEGWSFIPISGDRINRLGKDRIAEDAALDLAELDSPILSDGLVTRIDELSGGIARDGSAGCEEEQFHTWT